MKAFQPKRVLFEEEALQYPLGEKIVKYFESRDVEIRIIGSHNRVTGIPGNNPQQSYREAKQTLVVGVKRSLKLDPCKPSADFEFSLSTGCPGGCEYCYLQTHLGKKPYIRVYVNVDEILEKVRKTIDSRLPATTTFEAASTSDPLAVEHITGSLARAVAFFGRQSAGKLRVVTKFAYVEPLLHLDHQGRTKFRFSLNTEEIIRRFEHNTSSLEERIAAANQMAKAGYPLGFIIAPLFVYPGYRDGYEDLFSTLVHSLQPVPPGLTFELITHRFTQRAKNVILERFPGTGLDLDETKRRRKYGQYGLVKYMYDEADYTRLKEYIPALIRKYFPQASIEYFT